MPQLKGIIVDAESKPPSGGKGRTQHKYVVLGEDGRKSTMSTFDGKAFGEIKKGKTYLLTYAEAPNEKFPSRPFKNLELWQEVASMEEPKPVTRGDFQRSKEQTSLENMLIAAQGDWDKAIALYSRVQDWEAERVAVPTTATDSAAQEPKAKAAPKKAKPVVEPDPVGTMPPLEMLKALDTARRDSDGKEVVSTDELAESCAKAYEGKKVRELTEAELTKFTKQVEKEVAKRLKND